MRSLDTEAGRRRIGQAAWVMAGVGVVVGQLHALARFATADGSEDLESPLTAVWARPAGQALRPLLDWADSNLVYLHYGKVWFGVFAALTLCAWLVYRRRQPAGAERWVWRVTLVGYLVATVGVFVSYWTQWRPDYTEPWFTLGWYLDIPGLVLTLFGSSVLGVILLAKRFRPVLPAALLALALPLAVGIVQVTSLGNAVLPIAVAFGLLGWRMARVAPGQDAPTRDRATVGA
ncbi:MAG: hypothetical protein ACLGIF_08070 [Actinomycetes bacterium]